MTGVISVSNISSRPLQLTIAVIVLSAFFGCGDRSIPTSPSPLGNAAANGSRTAPEVERPCLPQPSTSQQTLMHVVLTPGVPSPNLCLQAPADEQTNPHETCWTVDAGGLVAPSASTLTISARPLIVDEQTEPFHLDSVDGRYRAMVTPTHVDIHDRRASRRLSHTPLTSENDGVSASVSGAYFVGDTLFLVDHDAGPHADVIGFRAGSDQPGTVADEVYHGSISVIDKHRIAFAGPALTTLTIYDTRTHERIQYSRDVPRTDACGDQSVVHDYLLEPDCDPPVDQRCCEHLDRHLGRYMDAPVGELADGRFLVALTGTHLGQIAIFDPGERTFVDHLSIICER